MIEAGSGAGGPMKRQWWHEKVAYQIYPKSFYDSNGDGIGDVPGIIEKLDHLAELGVDIIWLSPIYASPLADQGYDISDYYSIDPRFGTLKDVDRLLAEAHKRGMYILMDLVVNHCSDEHEWFKKACEDPDGKYGKYFYIVDRKEGEKLPCNWRSYFGGPVWDKLPGYTDKYYLHVFHKKQPDLNWENPELREEIYKMVNWWLDRGLDGFRLDAIINIKKALPFKDYEPDRLDRLSSIHAMLHDANGVGEFLSELRDRTFKPHNAFTVGEVFDEKPEELPDFIGDNGYFSSMFDFDAHVFGQSQKGWQENYDITPDDFRECIFRTQKKIRDIGFISNIIENHDEPRGVSRYIPEGECSVTAKKALAAVYFLLRGLPWIYQGQELGMENIRLTSINEVDDISSVDAYYTAISAGFSEKQALRLVEKYGRDNARTPFQWDGSEQAGFTTGQPWLAVNPNYKEINLEAEKKDPDSVFSFYKKLIALRKSEAYKETLVYGEFAPYLASAHNLIGYFRRSPEQTLLILANFQTRPVRVPLPEKEKLQGEPVEKAALNTEKNAEGDKDAIKLVLHNRKEGEAPEIVSENGRQEIILKGYQAVVLEV